MLDLEFFTFVTFNSDFVCIMLLNLYDSRASYETLKIGSHTVFPAQPDDLFEKTRH